MNLLLPNWIILTGTALLAFAISWRTIPLIIYTAKKLRIFDYPDNNRKIHSKAIPTLGGVTIFLAFLLSYSLSPWSDSLNGFSYLISALLILFFIGLRDDLITLSAWKKLVAQMIAGSLIIFGSGMVINNFHGIMGLTEIPYWIGITVTMFTIIVVINAINLIDGIDGLAGGIGMLASICFGLSFILAGQWAMAMFSFCLAGALLGFLRYNFSPASIFMGDTGSILLGFLLSVQSIKMLQLGTGAEIYRIFGETSPVLTVAFLALPLYDTLRVVFKRYSAGNPIFTPGQDHIHHELLRMGFSHRSACILLYVESILLIGLVTLLSLLGLNENIMLGVLILSCVVLYPTNGLKRLIFIKLFGRKWQRYYNKKWGLKTDYTNEIPLNGKLPVMPDHNGFAKSADEDVRKAEIDKITA